MSTQQATTIRIKSAIVVGAVPVVTKVAKRKPRRAVLAFVVVFFAMNFGLRFGMDYVFPTLRDPEYGRRLSRLKQHIAANPKREVTLVLGSSRTAMGLRPSEAHTTGIGDALVTPPPHPNPPPIDGQQPAGRPSTVGGGREQSPTREGFTPSPLRGEGRGGRDGDRDQLSRSTQPLIFNFAQVGSGPVMQLMTLRRLLHDGVKPDRVILEYWPPFLREDGGHAEEVRIDKHRLLLADEPFVRDYFEQQELTFATMRHVRKWPWYEHRLRLMSQIAPNWLTYNRRQDNSWNKMDEFGWLPGFERDPSPDERTARHQHAFGYYSELFRTYQLHPIAERATRELLDTCRLHGIRVAFVWLPESSEFRSWYSEDAKRSSLRFLKEIQAQYDVPMIDAREWVSDVHLADGFHLTQPGADVFSAKFGEAVRRLP